MTSTAADVTVLVSAYNAADYVGTALASVGAQTVAPGAIVVVDDGSTDDTIEVASSWAARLPVEVVALGENHGAGHARKVGVERTRTPLIAVLDADDYLLPDHIETLLDAYNRAGGLITAHELLWVAGVGVGPCEERHRTVPPPDEQLRKIINQCFVSIGTLFSREDCLRAGNWRAIGAEDWDLWIRMIRSGVRVTRGSHPTFLYQLRPSSVSFGTKAFDASLRVVERAAAEAESDQERRWAEQSLRRRRAKLALAQSYDLAHSGHPTRARLSAIKALRGEPETVMRAGFMAALPGLGAQLHERLLHDLARRIDR